MFQLFIGNLSTQANEDYLTRLFSAYGAVKSVTIVSQQGPSQQRHAVVLYEQADDADTAIASLHLRYCMSPDTPLLVLFHRDSPQVTEYGRVVTQSYRAAVLAGRQSAPVPLESYDQNFPRSNVPEVREQILPAVPPGPIFSPMTSMTSGMNAFSNGPHASFLRMT